MAYSLLGVFGIFLPLIYGEGRENAFSRLHEEIEKASKGRLLSHTFIFNVKNENEKLEIIN